MPAAPTSAARTSALAAALADWARTDGKTWIYLFKALVAAMLALGVALKLDLPQPRTAMTTVFVVMQPQSGAVFAKSTYRIIGTLVGLVVMLALIGLFAQQPELFIITTSLWIGLCTAGAARNRNFRSYGFVLAGYTAAMIGLPASQMPSTAFMTSLTRVAEIVVGILCSGFVSAVIFPEYAGQQMRASVRRRFSSFIDYASAALSGRLDLKQLETNTISARFIADIVGFEAARSIAIFENPEARMRSGRLARLNSEFMTASTRFHALHQLMNRLRNASSRATIGVLEPYFREIAALLDAHNESVLDAADAARMSEQLHAYQTALPRRIRATRAELQARLGEAGETSAGGEAAGETHAQAGERSERKEREERKEQAGAPRGDQQTNARLLDFDTASELMYRFLHELYEYTATYASLAVDKHERERWVERYRPKTSWVTALISGSRAAIVTMILGAFWLATAWPSGAVFVLNSAATCALAASSPNPIRMSIQMMVGTALAAVVGMIVTFGVFPHIDGFVMLCTVLVPVLAFGVFLTTRPKYAGYGVGYCIFFCFLAGPDNTIHYNPDSFMNDAIALILSSVVSAIAFATFLPSSARWLKIHLTGSLRRQVVHVCHARLRRLRNRFESGARDLMFQIDALSSQEPKLRSESRRWLFAVLEVGNATIDLRGELATLPAYARYSARMPWRVAIGAMLDDIGALFSKPGGARYARAISATDAATAAVQHQLTFELPREERHQFQRILSHLHFIRTALLDPQSPFATWAASHARASAPPPAQQGPQAPPTVPPAAPPSVPPPAPPAPPGAPHAP